MKSLESELLDAKRQLAESQRRGNTYSSSIASNENTEGAEDVQNTSSGTGRDWPLDSEEYARYGRQMIMPEIGLGGLLYPNFSANRLHSHISSSRATQTAWCIRNDYRTGWTGMPCCNLPGRCRRRNHWSCRRRCRRTIESPSADFAYHFTNQPFEG